MGSADIGSRATRVLTKVHDGNAELVTRRHVPALGSVWIIYGSVEDLQREKPAERGRRFSGGHGALSGIALVLIAFAGWCQHLYSCFNEGVWGFLIAGAILSPIGIIDGWGIWFGWW